MRNPQIQQMLEEMLDQMVEPSLKRLAEGLEATKRRAFVTKTGEIRYTDPEPDCRVRVSTANGILDRHQRLSSRHVTGPDADIVPGNEQGAEVQKECAGQVKTEGVIDRSPSSLGN